MQILDWPFGCLAHWIGFQKQRQLVRVYQAMGITTQGDKPDIFTFVMKSDVATIVLGIPLILVNTTPPGGLVNMPCIKFAIDKGYIKNRGWSYVHSHLILSRRIIFASVELAKLGKIHGQSRIRKRVLLPTG